MLAHGILSQMQYAAEAAAAAPGYGVPPSGDSDCFIFYDIGNPASYPGSGTTVTDLKGNANATLTGNGWSYDGGVSLGVIDQAGRGTNNRYWSVANPNFSGWTGTTFEALWRSDQALSGTGDNGFYRWVNQSGFSDTTIEMALQQYNGSPVPNRIYADMVSEQGSKPTPFYPSWVGTAGSWWHMVITAEQGGNCILYVNDTAIATTAGTFGASDTFNWDSVGAIFGSDGGVGGNVVGQFAALRMYDRALTSGEVTANYNYYDAIVGF